MLVTLLMMMQLLDKLLYNDFVVTARHNGNFTDVEKRRMFIIKVSSSCKLIRRQEIAQAMHTYTHTYVHMWMRCGKGKTLRNSGRT